jgi:hypothetical protein
MFIDYFQIYINRILINHFIPILTTLLFPTLIPLPRTNFNLNSIPTSNA